LRLFSVAARGLPYVHVRAFSDDDYAVAYGDRHRVRSIDRADFAHRRLHVFVDRALGDI
jgi:hypothetical protein